jgi:heat-inducible transcriptional repressor
MRLANRRVCPNLCSMLTSLDPRASRLLHALIAQHIRDGEPVPSRTLARLAGLEVSPATIRNIMANLESVGLLAAPHTSAGRVPTSQAYRVFVDSLLEIEPLREAEINRLRAQMAPGISTQMLLSQASELLSSMSQFVGVVTVPQRLESAFKHIDFVPLDDQRVLVILVFPDNEVQNRIVQLPRAFSAQELEQAANYLNRHFSGRSFAQIQHQLLVDMRQAKSELDRLLNAALDISQQLMVPDSKPEDMVLSGQTRLMGMHGMSDMDRLRSLFEAFSQKRDILGLLDSCSQAQGIRVFIGEESGLAPLRSCTVITAPYSSQGQVLGVLGVIGPTRMPYERVIPIVKATADLLGDALKLA